MAQFTTNIYAQKVEQLMDSKESVISDALDKFDAALAGKKTIGITGNYTLVGADVSNESRTMLLKVVGSLSSPATLSIPVGSGTGRSRLMIVHNSTGQTLTVKTTAGGSMGVNVSTGQKVLVYHDDTNVYEVVGSSSSTVPSCRVYNSATQSIADNSLLLATFNSERWDTDNIHDTVTNPSRLTCKTAGKYYIFCVVTFSANSTGFRRVHFKYNNTTFICMQDSAAAGGGNSSIVAASTVWDMSVNDYVELYPYHTAGTTLTLDNGLAYGCEFGMVKVG